MFLSESTSYVYLHSIAVKRNECPCSLNLSSNPACWCIFAGEMVSVIVNVWMQWLNVDRCWRTGPWLSATFSRITPAITRAW